MSKRDIKDEETVITDEEIAIGPNRTPRESETRTAEKSVEYVPPGVLPEFNKDPQYDYRWIRVSTLGNPDNMNVNARFREGWEPVKAEDHPEIQLFNPDRRYEGLVEHGGLLLCKASKEKMAARKRYYSQRARDQVEAVDNDFLRLNDSRMPVFRDKSSRVIRGKKED